MPGEVPNVAMGRRKQEQPELFIGAGDLPRSPGHPFYRQLNRLLSAAGFDDFVEEECAQFYATKQGRPSIAPGVYFRLLLIGYFEGLDSERGIAWRVADSLTLREFLGYGLSAAPPDHSTLSRTRRRMSSESHQRVFSWVLALLAREGLVRGKTVGVDATTLEANAALRSIVRRDTGVGYTEFLESLAKESGIETPTRSDLTKLDRKRQKKGSNQEWQHPHDPDAQIAKMKDGRTRLAHKVEHGVDMETGALLGVTVQPASRGDTKSLAVTLEEVGGNLEDVVDDGEAVARLSNELLAEVVADKGYHSALVLESCDDKEVRTYISEPDRGRRRWKGKKRKRKLTYANRRRGRGARGKSLQRQRGEIIERSFAHCYDTGGMRRSHLRGHDNLFKRLLIHAAGFNLALVMRRVAGHGKPRALQGLVSSLRRLLSLLRELFSRPPARRAASRTPTWAGWRNV